MAGLHQCVDGYFAKDLVKRALVCTSPIGEPPSPLAAVHGQAQDEAGELAAIAADEAMTERALEILRKNGRDVHEHALEALHESTWAWWADALEEEE